jgi:hypothetical protein
MNKLFKVFGIIALAALIGFSMAACPADAGGGGSTASGGGGGSVVRGETTYNYTDGAGNAYALLITQAARAAYTPNAGDAYVLTITFKDGTVQKNTGRVEGFEDGKFTLKSSDNKEFSITVTESGTIAGIAGDDLPFRLPEPKKLNISAFTNSTNSDDEYYNRIVVLLIEDLTKWSYVNKDYVPFLEVTAIENTPTTITDTPDDVEIKLYVPIDNVNKMPASLPWTGTGNYYVVIFPAMNWSWVVDKIKIYKGDGSDPLKVEFTTDPVPLEFSKFKDWSVPQRPQS